MHAIRVLPLYSVFVFVCISMLQSAQPKETGCARMATARATARATAHGTALPTITGRQSHKNNTLSLYHCVSTFGRYY